jgi:hypothetical protein
VVLLLFHIFVGQYLSGSFVRTDVVVVIFTL